MVDMTARIDKVRAFNRFYTKHVGALNENLLNSEFTLTEMRILYELHAQKSVSAAQLSKELGLNAAYLSRILKKFKSGGLIKSVRSPDDARKWMLTLTENGETVFAPYTDASRREVAAVMDVLTEQEQYRLLTAMETITRIIGPEPEVKQPYVIRDHRPGDISWVVHRHGRLYFEEYGFDDTFESEVANIAQEFLENYSARTEHFWIAERNGIILGSVCLVNVDINTAQLRLLYVEPEARGDGVGKALVAECVNFARAADYSNLILWTQSQLKPAIKIYENAGFHLTDEHPHRGYGSGSLTTQMWQLIL
ncbi:MAG: MarR family transcriptional regulator [Sneathiella sp.]|nr:MAG: MarR family transcriptional regulator [Sneathiella sp.]